jgi:hypothetical protein
MLDPPGAYMQSTVSCCTIIICPLVRIYSNCTCQLPSPLLVLELGNERGGVGDSIASIVAAECTATFLSITPIPPCSQCAVASSAISTRVGDSIFPYMVLLRGVLKFFVNNFHQDPA